MAEGSEFVVVEEGSHFWPRGFVVLQVLGADARVFDHDAPWRCPLGFWHRMVFGRRGGFVHF